MAPPSTDAAGDLPNELPEALRKVIGSRYKLAVLCALDDGPSSTKDLAQRLNGIVRPQALNMHLTDLEALGFIQISGGIEHHPNQPRQWGLCGPPGWTAFARGIVEHAPPTEPAA